MLSRTTSGAHRATAVRWCCKFPWQAHVLCGLKLWLWRMELERDFELQLDSKEHGNKGQLGCDNYSTPRPKSATLAQFEVAGRFRQTRHERAHKT